MSTFVKTAAVGKDRGRVTEVARAVGRRQRVELAGGAAHECPPHRQQRRRHGRRFISDRSRSPLGAQRREGDVADRKAGDDVLVGVLIEVAAEHLAVFGGVGFEGDRSERFDKRPPRLGPGRGPFHGLRVRVEIAQTFTRDGTDVAIAVLQKCLDSSPSQKLYNKASKALRRLKSG